MPKLKQLLYDKPKPADMDDLAECGHYFEDTVYDELDLTVKCTYCAIILEGVTIWERQQLMLDRPTWNEDEELDQYNHLKVAFGRPERVSAIPLDREPLEAA